MAIPLLLVINNFLHDFSAAMLLCSAICIWLVRRNFHGDAGGVSSVIARNITSKLSLIFYLSLGFVVIGGAIRAWAYRTYEWITPLGQSQVTVLIVKHALFAACLLVAVYIVLKKK
ncbi:MAG: hypothetical protein HZA48_10330 [Planctomycetes bacterium]|nr:hypothetical protein [Planctomycetota bacterium]